MTDLPCLGHDQRPSASTWPSSGILMLYATAASAAAIGVAFAVSAPPDGSIEWQLELLLRFMAVVKAAMVLGALALTHWRLRLPIDAVLSVGYTGAIALMLIATGLIFGLAHVALGAGLFHIGLLTFLVLAWRDDAAGKVLSRRMLARRLLSSSDRS